MKKNKNKKKNNKFNKFINDFKRDILNWAIFIMVAITLTMKIMEVSAYNTLILQVNNLESSFSNYKLNNN